MPRFGDWLDHLAIEQAASDLTTAVAVARNRAMLRATPARISIAADSLRTDERVAGIWTAAARWPGPGSHGVGLVVSNPTVLFDARGIGAGVANTRVVLLRGSHTATITISRVGRVKRW